MTPCILFNVADVLEERPDSLFEVKEEMYKVPCALTIETVPPETSKFLPYCTASHPATQNSTYSPI
jgi:hypothetical protein